MSPSVDVRGERFAWREAGRGDGLPIVLLHGLGGSRISWEPQLAGLSERRRVAAWDLPGYGESPADDGPLTFVRLADDVAAFADELGAERFHLVGISFGGMIAQYAAVAHRERVDTLTLLSTSPCFGLDGTSPDAWRAARLAPLDAGREPADFAEAVLAGIAGPGISPVALAGQRAAMARITGAALRRAIDCIVAHDSRAVLGSVAAPTLCLAGELDTETPAAYAEVLAELIPGARVEVLPGAGHLLNVEAPEAVNALIEEHIERVERG
ncbi:MAG: alpha/beta fold hydrolase [Acidimicrobiia bacterium]